jgi:hypothetical protein
LSIVYTRLAGLGRVVLSELNEWLPASRSVGSLLADQTRLRRSPKSTRFSATQQNGGEAPARRHFEFLVWITGGDIWEFISLKAEFSTMASI